MEAQTNRVGRQHILEIAERLFTERGYRAASIREIARACGVTNAALYYHFPDKESLFAEVITQHALRLSRRLNMASSSAARPRERLEAVMLEYMRIVQEHQSPFFLIRREAAGLRHELVAKNLRQMFVTLMQPLRDALSQAQKEGALRTELNADDASAVLLGMLHGLAQQRRTCLDCDPQLTSRDIHMIVDIFWKGVARE